MPVAVPRRRRVTGAPPPKQIAEYVVQTGDGGGGGGGGAVKTTKNQLNPTQPNPAKNHTVGRLLPKLRRNNNKKGAQKNNYNMTCVT